MIRFAIPFLSAVLLLFGCSTRSGVRPHTSEVPETSDRFSIAIVIESGMEASLDGIADALNTASDEFGAETRSVTVSKNDVAKSFASTLAENPDLTIYVGSDLTDEVRNTIMASSNRKVAVVDHLSFAPNVLGITFRLEQGAFLAGLVAAATSKSGKIGLIMESGDPNATKIEAGFRAGAKTVNAKLADSILVSKTESAVSAANQLFQSGADVVFCGTPALVRETAEVATSKQRHVIALGAAPNKAETDAILVTVMKNGEKAILDATRMAKEGTFQGRTLELGIKDEYISLSELSEVAKALVPKKALDAVEEAKKMILDGALIVPRTDAELAKFKPPRLAAFL